MHRRRLGFGDRIRESRWTAVVSVLSAGKPGEPGEVFSGLRVWEDAVTTQLSVSRVYSPTSLIIPKRA